MFSRNFAEFSTGVGDKYSTFWSFSGGHTVCIHDLAMKYMAVDWVIMERMLKLLI